MNVEATAIPLPFVVAVAVTAPLANTPLAPLLGAAKVTVTLATPLPDPSLTAASRPVEKAVPTLADCPPPAAGVTVDGGPTNGDVLVLEPVVVPPPQPAPTAARHNTESVRPQFFQPAHFMAITLHIVPDLQAATQRFVKRSP